MKVLLVIFLAILVYVAVTFFTGCVHQSPDGSVNVTIIGSPDEVDTESAKDR